MPDKKEKELNLGTELEKALPPKVRYRFYAWLNRFKAKKPKTPDTEIKKAIDEIYGEYMEKGLKKHGSISRFDDGSIRMDFKGGVDDKVKKAALEWAKKRGLKVIEESISKSANSDYYVVFGSKPLNIDAILIQVSEVDF